MSLSRKWSHRCRLRYKMATECGRGVETRLFAANYTSCFPLIIVANDNTSDSGLPAQTRLRIRTALKVFGVLTVHRVQRHD